MDFWTREEQQLASVVFVVGVLTVLHLVVGDWELATTLLHATLPLWSALAVLCLLFAFLWKAHRLTLLSSVFLAGFHVTAFWAPWVRGAPAPGQRSVRIVSANLWGNSPDRGPILRELAAIDADVLVLLEVDSRWETLLREAPLWTAFPYRQVEVRPGDQGMAILSQMPLRQPEVLDVAGSPQISVNLALADREIRLLGVHLTAPTDTARATTLARQVQGLRTWIEQPGLPPPLLIGSFEITPWNPTFGTLARAPVNDARARIGSAPWPTWRPLPGALDVAVAPLDHVLASDRIRIHTITLGNGHASDHRPLIVDVSW